MTTAGCSTTTKVSVDMAGMPIVHMPKTAKYDPTLKQQSVRIEHRWAFEHGGASLKSIESLPAQPLAVCTCGPA